MNISDFPIISQEQAWTELERSGVMVTVNSRASRSLGQGYADFQSRAGSAVFETPHILPLAAWLQQVFQKFCCLEQVPEPDRLPAVLTTDQELLLWEAIVSESPWSQGMLRRKETAGLAARASALCRAWRIRPERLQHWDLPDYQAFSEWRQMFSERIQAANWLEPAALPDAVAELTAQGEISLPPSLILAGFDDITPQQLRLLQVFLERGCRLFRLEPPDHHSHPVRFCAPDAGTEMEYAAAWARSAVEQEPGTRVGIIVPDLTSRKDALVRTLTRVLHPEQSTSFELIQNPAFNVSLGKTLGEYPLINAALRALNLVQDPFPLSQCLFVLHSPFFGDGTGDFHERSRLETRLRGTGEAFIPRQFFKRQVLSAENGGKSGEGRSPGERFRSFFEVSEASPDNQSLSDWADHFHRLLAALGWPGGRSLSSAEYQCLGAWSQALQRLASLDLVGRPSDSARALVHLEHLVGQTAFQPEQEDVDIQVLGLLEAVHEDFDQIWIMGLTDEDWPPPARPHPLLPVPLQQELGLPHASAERELAFCSQVTERMIRAAPGVVLSYPGSEQDRHLFPSPFIVRFPEIENPLPRPGAQKVWERIFLSRDMEVFTDQQGPQLEPGSRIRGGTGILKAQSLCPFQAFARYRLGAEDPEEPLTGLGPAERGTLVHAALESCWETLLSQDHLQRLDAGELQSLAARAASKALIRLKVQHPLTLSDRFSSIEESRLQRLLLEWMELEKDRPPFTVLGNEQRRILEIDRLFFQVVVDRIDRLDDGNILVVDYKTGQYTVRDWLGVRPAEPQVPFYSLVGEQEPAGVYFGLVRRGDCRYIGIGKEKNLIPGTFDFEESPFLEEYGSWNGLLEFWKQQLEDLAGEIRRGWAAVSPLSKQKSCRFCTLQPLCRIHEQEAHSGGQHASL